MPENRKRPRKVKLEDIAAKCGVSVSTVSRALAGEKGVRPELRRQVIEAANAVSYALPASVAGNKIMLAASSAAMIDYVRNQFTWHVLDGLNARAATLGVEIVTRAIADVADELRVVAEAQADPEVGGLLILTVDDEEMLAATAGLGKPVVMINGDDPFMRLSSVTPCNRSAARVATQHLIDAGHKRILFLMRPGRRTIQHRMDGWRDALVHNGLAADESLVLSVDDWLPDLAADAVTAHLAERGRDFSAVLTAGDSLAAGAMRGLQQAGLSVPDDVSVMGMDDLPQSAFLNPPLTTMNIPMRAIGAAALDLLRDGMLGFGAPARRVELACHLVTRASTGPARA